MLTAGDSSLHADCQSCFHAFCFDEHCHYLGVQVGPATRMYLILQMIGTVSQAVLAEGLALGEWQMKRQKRKLCRYMSYPHL